MTGEHAQLGRYGRVATVVATALAIGLLSVGPTAAQSPSPLPAPTSDVWRLADVEGPPDQPFRDVVKWSGGFAAIGWPRNAYRKGQSLKVPVWLSSDGSVWQRSRGRVTLPSRKADATHLVAFQGGLMAFGSEGANLVAWRSSNGQRWQRLPHRPLFESRRVPSGPPYFLEVLDAVAGDGRIVISGWYGAAGDNTFYVRTWTSPNGRSWETDVPDLPYLNAIFSLGVGPHGYLGRKATNSAVEGCEDDGDVPVRSGNGLDWRVVTKARPVCGMLSIAYDKASDRYFATAITTKAADDSARVVVLRSKDRRTWREAYVLPVELDGEPWSTGPGELHIDDGVITVLGEGDRVDADDNGISTAWALVSDDGRDWHFSVVWPGGEAEAGSFALGHGRLVVADRGKVWYADLVDLGVEPDLPVPFPDQAVKRPGPPPRYKPAGSATAVAQTNGIKTELWIKDDTIDRGQWLLAHLRITNTGQTPVKHNGTFEQLACPPIDIELDTRDAHDPGVEWGGVAAEFKDEILRTGWWTKAELSVPDRDRRGDCRLGQSGSLAPGESIDVPLAGLPRYISKRPLPPGPLHVSASFEGKRDGKKITTSVRTDVTLSGVPVSYPSPGQLVDVALETEGFLDVLEAAEDAKWANSHISWWPKPPYPEQSRFDAGRDAPNGLLEITQFLTVPTYGEGSAWTDALVTAVVDPWTGESFGAYQE